MLQLISAIMLLLFLSTAARAAPIATGDLTELIDVERAAYLRDSVCAQVSSYDRTGGNNDGFDGKYSYIRKEGENLVIFDAEGPGCVYRLWSADPLDGWVKFYFDGEETPRLELEHFRDMFTGAVYPFIPPLSQHFIGGWCSYVPIPFAKSLKIVAGGPVNFLQITWQRFGGAEGVTTFDPNYSPENRRKLDQVKAAWLNPGKPPLPYPKTAHIARRTLTISPGKTGSLIELTGAGLVRALKIKPDSRDVKIGRKTLLLLNVDGQQQPNVYSPLADFFLDPYPGEECKSMLLGKVNDHYYSYWVMPYADGAAITVKNESATPLKLSYEVVYEPMKQLPEGMGRFFAWWHRQPRTVNGEFFPMLEARGRGQWCGVSHAMRNEAIGIGFLEGDEMLWIDDRDNTFYNGTGTEDYFNGGWYFGNTGSAPLYGCGLLDERGIAHAYRFQLTDMVPFQQTAKIMMEHGPVNSWPNSDYAGVTYWYAAPGTTHGFTPIGMPARLNRPEPRRGVTEAETLLDPAAGGKVVDDSNETICLSSAKGIATLNAHVGESFTLLVDAPADGVYYLEMGLVTGPHRGIARVAVDGQALSEPIDTYAKEPRDAMPALIGMTQPLAKGPHRITVTSAGKNRASRAAGLMLDFITFRSNLLLEAEKLPVSSVKGGKQAIKAYVNTSGFYDGSEASNWRLLWLGADKPGAAITLRFPVLRSGRQRLTLGLCKFPSGGNLQFKLDGQPVPLAFDGYEYYIRFDTLDLGEWELAAGEHELAIEVTGKREKSSGYNLAVDWLSIK